MSDSHDGENTRPTSGSKAHEYSADEDWQQLIERLDESDRARDLEWRRRHIQLGSFAKGTVDDDAALDRLSSTSPDQDTSLLELEAAKEWRDNVWLQGGSLNPRNRPLVKRKSRGTKLNAPVTGHCPFRLFSRVSGKKVFWDFQFPTSDHLQRFLYVKRILDAGHLSNAKDTERQALLISRFGDYLEDQRFTTKDLAQRFRVKYSRFRRLVAEFNAFVDRFDDDYREYNHILRNNPAPYPIDSAHLLIFLVSTGEAYLLNRKLERRQKIERPSPRLKAMFPFLPWR